MAKYYGKIGYYFDDYEISPGVFVEKIIEKEAYGDSKRIFEQTENLNQVNNGININVQISIMADQYAMDNLSRIKYATYAGTKWSVKTIAPDYPRLIIDIGGVYNE